MRIIPPTRIEAATWSELLRIETTNVRDQTGKGDVLNFLPDLIQREQAQGARFAVGDRGPSPQRELLWYTNPIIDSRGTRKGIVYVTALFMSSERLIDAAIEACDLIIADGWGLLPVHYRDADTMVTNFVGRVCHSEIIDVRDENLRQIQSAQAARVLLLAEKVRSG